MRSRLIACVLVAGCGSSESARRLGGRQCVGRTFETPDLPGFYVIANGPAQVINSMILR